MLLRTARLPTPSPSSENADLAVAPKVLRERSTFRAAWSLGKAVVETEPQGKAASEVVVIAGVDFCTPDAVQEKALSDG